MSPLWWMTLMMMFISMLLLIMCNLYFSKNFKIYKIKKKSFMMNWKW